MMESYREGMVSYPELEISMHLVQGQVGEIGQGGGGDFAQVGRKPSC